MEVEEEEDGEEGEGRRAEEEGRRGGHHSPCHRVERRGSDPADSSTSRSQSRLQMRLSCMGSISHDRTGQESERNQQ